MAKYIFVTGGVVSGLGKGITAASLGRLLKERGFHVAAQKLDPYINIDPGTMSPYQHGEVFVTEDGAETDLDLGHYERFIDENLNQFSNLTTGKVYWNVLTKERRGEYLGETVQVIPHITDEIKRFIYSVQKKTDADIVITEIGGTTGDIESQPFLEAIRQIGREVGVENRLFIHVTLIPYLESSGEHKSKPTQHSVKELQSFGIVPDIIVARCDKPVDAQTMKKIALFCNVKPDCVIENRTLPILYGAPVMLRDAGLDRIVLRELHLPGADTPCDLTHWEEMLGRIQNCRETVRVALVGKYVKLHDSYLSVMEALHHAGWENGVRTEISWIDSEGITSENAAQLLENQDAVIVPGGFGGRGIEGMIETARYARENGIPYLGICLGMQFLMRRSFEGGEHAGLGLCAGDVVRFTQGKVPAIGWNGVTGLRTPLFEGLPEGSEFYFVHSYYAPVGAYTIGRAEYGAEYSAAVWDGRNAYGVQFHPEKSGETGLRLLRNFLHL